MRKRVFNVDILIFHGYLLRGTGSNVYNARLAASMSSLGARIHLFCQDRAADTLDFVDAVGDWDSGALSVRTLREPVRVTTYRPPIGRLLPVYVEDRYEGFDAKRFADCTDDEIEDYLARNVMAVREVAQLAQPGVALANHLVMGPVILARALADVPYTAKIHGSALEYTVKPDMERFGPWAREGLARARGILVGSRHTAESLWAAMDDDSLPPRTRLGPPGVDVRQFRPHPPEEAKAAVRDLARDLAALPVEVAAEGDGFARDNAAAAAAIAGLNPGDDRLIAFVGKLLAAKGVDLLVAAFPLVLAAEPRAKLVIVGFGEFRDGLLRLLALLAAGDLAGAREFAERGGERGPLNHLRVFLEDLESSDDRDAYLAAAARLPERCVLTGRLEHPELAELLPACEAQVVPSTFPEAFGMVAAEAAACGILPVSASHSGLAEVTRALAAAVPEQAQPWLDFEVGDGAVRDLASSLISWLQAPEDVREATRAGIVEVVREKYSWEGLAPHGRGVGPRRAFRARAGHVGSGHGPDLTWLPAPPPRRRRSRPTPARPVPRARLPRALRGPDAPSRPLLVELHDRRGDRRATLVDLGRVPGAPARDGHEGHPLRHEVVEVRHDLGGRLARRPARRRRDRGRVPHRVLRRRLHHEPAAGRRDRRQGVGRLHLRGRAAAIPSTAVPPGSWCRTCTSGRARSGSGGSR